MWMEYGFIQMQFSWEKLSDFRFVRRTPNIIKMVSDRLKTSTQFTKCII